MAIWVDVTTSYNWQRPAVGVVRVEMEVIKKMLATHCHSEIKFFRYDNTLKQFIILTRTDVESIVQRIIKGEHAGENAAARLEAVTNGKQKFINFRKAEAKHFAITASHNTYFLLLSFINPVHHNQFKRQVKTVLGKCKRIFYYIYGSSSRIFSALSLNKSKTGEKHVVDSPEIMKASSIFLKNDTILSLGAVWNYPNINTDFHSLKKDLDVKIYSISFDLIPIIQPHLCLDYVSAMFKKLYYDMTWYSSHIFCISKHTAQDLDILIDKTGLPNVAKSIITLGCDIHKAEEQDNDITNFIAQNSSYLLFVSTIESRKNHDLIYKVMSKWIDEGVEDFPDIVIVGMPGWGVDDLLTLISRDKRLHGKLHILNNVSDIGLKQLYEACLFTLYPSYYEGWGLPVTESLAYGKFCISSNTSSMPEAGFGFVDLLSPYDISEWSARILHYYNEPNNLSKKELLIKESFEAPTWANTANTIIQLVDKESNYQC